jgi:hypothetical protein
MLFQASLRPDEMILEYVLGEEQSYCLKITGTDASVVVLPFGRERIEGLVEEYREWLDAPRPTFGEMPTDWPSAFQVSAIISNGRKPTEPISVFLEACVSVVEQYVNAGSEPWPTLREHTEAHDAAAVAESPSIR